MEEEYAEAVMDYCDICCDSIWYGDDGIACDWSDLAVEHECDVDPEELEEL